MFATSIWLIISELYFMKLLTLNLVSLLLISGSFNSQKSERVSEPIAVIELFTSQGCSSCPSADKLLSNLVASADGKEIYALSFHVSYWNRLGWTDPYSSEQFTQRQRKYGTVMNLQTIYTPQMVVNGEYEFVGSSKTKADYYLEKALLKPADVNITLKNVDIKNGLLSFQYSLDEEGKDNLLNVAIVEKQVENHVPRGENRGLTLKHENVVIQYKTINVNNSGLVNLELEASVDLKDCSLIVYLQDKKSLKIYGRV